LNIFKAAGKTGKDATGLIEQIKGLEGAAKHKDYMRCMDNLFFAGLFL
jgi:hypothetical protein